MEFRIALARQLMTLFNNMAVLILTAYVFSRTRVYQEIWAGRITRRNTAVLVLIMGGLAIYGTLSGVNVLGNIANIRNLGPMIAGLIAGPVAGVLTGLVGGAHRLTFGGDSALACSLACVLAGLGAGLLYLANGRRFVGMKRAVAFAAAFELVHSGLVLLFYGVTTDPGQILARFDEAWDIELRTTLPRVLLVSVGIGVFAFIIDNLAKERRLREEKEQAERELAVAREIQQNIVPKIFPTFPDTIEYEIYAELEPAREVGGDFYDFFTIGENRICFSIGDVADKGVPSSLFMAVSKTLLKAKHCGEMDPAQLLGAVNEELCLNNDTMMFVTIFCGIIDLATGEVAYSNGGHNLPFTVRREGEVAQVANTEGAALGVIPGAPYGVGRLTLAPGDGIFLYTDGVNEAENRDGEFFGYERLAGALRESRGGTSREIVTGIMSGVEAFYAGMPPHDDVTILHLRYMGAGA